MKRLKETEEQKENRLRKQRDIMAKRMLKETKEHRQTRLQQNRETNAKKRSQ
jgi:hypothetical protein